MVLNYNPHTDSPINVHYRGDCYPGLAVEDRDLLTEASDQWKSLVAIANAVIELYPSVAVSSGFRSTLSN